MIRRWRVQVEGTVQGVGFRPFTYRLAGRYGLVGLVRNEGAAVVIEVEGHDEHLDAFLSAVQTEAPPLARIDRVGREVLPVRGDRGFAIEESQTRDELRVVISPDAATCPDCLRELFAPGDRRYRYPFINCTNCGPRLTIIRGVPYDRERTTMAAFTMCPACRQEFEDPNCRRFHAQPNACPHCGPQVYLVDGSGEPLEQASGEGNGGTPGGRDAVARAATLLRTGWILAVKGLGGYHLACDATDREAVARLRSRKGREAKPLAVMAASLEEARSLCQVDGVAAQQLTSARRPVVVLPRRSMGSVVPEVAPGQSTLGLMLPYTPLHHLLLRDAGRPLVMTSGNLSEEPIAYRDGDALERLRTIADAFLIHNREIHLRCDDSVLRAGEGRAVFIRRSRGYVPDPVPVPQAFPVPVLATGGHLKNTFALGHGRQVLMSHHIGDLENLGTWTSFTEGIKHFQRVFQIEPVVVAHDLHPGYLSTRFALSLEGVDRVGVQHHHAHIAACLADNGVAGPVIGVAFDGTGYGVDGAVWGGEFLIADLASYRRVVHLAYVPLPGGEQAIHQPWRMAAAHLRGAFGPAHQDLDLPLLAAVGRKNWRMLDRVMERGLNSPPTSSVGRLFDAVAAVTGICTMARFEGQAAMALEAAVDRACRQSYPIPLRRCEGETWVIETGPLWRELVNDVRQGTPVGVIAARFQNGLAAMIVEVCAVLRERWCIGAVALSGGVFQNLRLLVQVTEGLEREGFMVYTHRMVPPNDGGLSLGQAVVAAAMIAGA